MGQQNGVRICLLSVINPLHCSPAGRSFFGYIGMSLQFEGSAELPPEWEDRTTAAHTVVEGNYHVLKLAQQVQGRQGRGAAGEGVCRGGGRGGRVERQGGEAGEGGQGRGGAS